MRSYIALQKSHCWLHGDHVNLMMLGPSLPELGVQIFYFCQACQVLNRLRYYLAESAAVKSILQ